jgi:hypothetical protein
LDAEKALSPSKGESLALSVREGENGSACGFLFTELLFCSAPICCPSNPSRSAGFSPIVCNVQRPLPPPRYQLFRRQTPLLTPFNDIQLAELASRTGNVLVDTERVRASTAITNDAIVMATGARNTAKEAFAAKLRQLQAAKATAEMTTTAHRARKQRLEAHMVAMAADLAGKDAELAQVEADMTELRQHLQQQRAIARAPAHVRTEMQQGTLVLEAGPEPPPVSSPPKRGHKTGRTGRK